MSVMHGLIIGPVAAFIYGEHVLYPAAHVTSAADALGASTPRCSTHGS